jgi:hypothetical protein
MNDMSHDAVMIVVRYVVVVNLMVVTLFCEGWTYEQRHRHGESGNNIHLHLRSPGCLPDRWQAGA